VVLIGADRKTIIKIP